MRREEQLNDLEKTVSVQELEIKLLREAIDRSNLALAEAVKTKEEHDQLLLQVGEMRPVVEAAITWKKNERWPYLAQGGVLAHAIDAYEKTQIEKLAVPVPIERCDGSCGISSCIANARLRAAKENK